MVVSVQCATYNCRYTAREKIIEKGRVALLTRKGDLKGLEEVKAAKRMTPRRRSVMNLMPRRQDAMRGEEGPTTPAAVRTKGRRSIPIASLDDNPAAAVPAAALPSELAERMATMESKLEQVLAQQDETTAALSLALAGQARILSILDDPRGRKTGEKNGQGGGAFLFSDCTPKP